MIKLSKELQQKGYKTGIVTDNKIDRMERIISHFNLRDTFSSIVISAEVGSGKNREDIFLKTFCQLSVKPNECVFIDNKKENLIVPKSLGVLTLFFDDTKKDVSKLRKELNNLGIK
jgi:putative hydrolase of the HAD superfamily